MSISKELQTRLEGSSGGKRDEEKSHHPQERRKRPSVKYKDRIREVVNVLVFHTG